MIVDLLIFVSVSLFLFWVMLQMMMIGALGMYAVVRWFLSLSQPLSKVQVK